MKALLGFIIVAAVATVLIAFLPAPQPETSADAPIPRIAVEKHTLANGLEVLFVEDHRLPRVSVDLWYHVGPVNEEPGRTGFAHLFEHMMFQKSKHVPEDAFFKILEGVGASGMNGTTDFDRTNYFETVPSNQLELALWLESDRMGYLLDELTADSFKNQQDVVRNERREQENQPFGIVQEAAFHTLFPKGHPYYGVVIGSHQDIQAANVADARNFFKQYYSPNNASLAIVGDIDKAKTLALVEKHFGLLKRGPDVPRVDVTTPPITSERRLVVKDRVELPRLYMAWLTPPVFTPGDAEAHLAAGVLGQGKSSRLYQRLVYDKQIAQDVVAYNDSLTLASTFFIEATARAGHTLEELEAEIDLELNKLRNEGPSLKELDRAKASAETGTLFSLESNGGFNGIADRINRYNHHMKDPNYLEQDILRYRKATSEGVHDFAAKYLSNSARVVVFGVPGPQDLGPPVPTPGKVVDDSPAESVNQDEPWRATRPAGGAPVALTIPAPTSFVLPNGLTVILDRRKGSPVFAANLVFRSGSGSNPVEKPGLASFTLDMLDEGTSTRSATEFASELEQIGARLAASAASDYSSLKLTAARNRVETGLNLVADALLNPAFSAAEIERVRKTRLGELTQLSEDPWSVANRALALALNGADSAYAYPELGTADSVQAISSDDLRAFWASRLVPGNAAIIVSGDFERRELGRLLEKTFGSWETRSSSQAVLKDPVASPTSSRLVLVDMPGSPQTQLRVAVLGPPRSTPDYALLQVMNMILGGSFASRINMNLREEHGYTYGASSRFTYLRNGGWFSVSSGVRTDVTAPATEEVIREIGRMGAAPVSAEELGLAKELFIGSLPARFETTEGTVDMLRDVYLYDLGLGYFTGFAGKVASVPISSVQAVATKYLAPDKMMVVAVGDRRKIEGELKKAIPGDMELRDVEGKVLSD